MKMKRDEFKAILKECLEELINEGALNDILPRQVVSQPLYSPPQGVMPAPVDPRARMLALQTAKNPTEAMMLEKLYTDTANTTYQAQASSDTWEVMQNGGYVPQVGYATQQPQYMPVPQAQPLFPQQQYQQQAQANNNGGHASNWARLAFNSPIRNRPSSETAIASGLGIGSSGFLPGMGNNNR